MNGADVYDQHSPLPYMEEVVLAYVLACKMNADPTLGFRLRKCCFQLESSCRATRIPTFQESHWGSFFTGPCPRVKLKNHISFPEHQQGIFKGIKETQDLKKECGTLLYFNTREQELNQKKNRAEQAQRTCQQ